MHFVEGELVRLSNAMKDTYKPHWPADMTPTSENAPEFYVQHRVPAGTTNQIRTIGPITVRAGPKGSADPVFSYSTDPPTE